MPESSYSTNGRSHRTGSGYSSYSSNSSYDLFQHKRTLDEFPMEHNWEDTAQLYARRRQEKEEHKRNLASNCGESHQLSSYGRKRFDKALAGTGKSLPPPSPEEKRIFWDEVKPSWVHRRHHSVVVPPKIPHVQLAIRPGSEPPGSVAARNVKGGGFSFNHLRGNNDMYPKIKQLLQESNYEYRVVCSPLSDQAQKSSSRRPSEDHSVITDCYLVPLKEAECQVAILSEPQQEEAVEKEDVDSVDRSAEHLGDDKSGRCSQIKDQPVEEKVRPSIPWRCWVDDATVSTLSPEPETESQAADGTTASPSPAPEQTAEVLALPSVLDTTDKSKLEIPDKPAKESTTLLSDKVKGSRSRSPDNPSSKRRSTSKMKRKKGRRGTPEPSTPVEEVQLPPPPPPQPPTPPIVDFVEEELLEVPSLPSYICPSSTAKSTNTEIKLWLRKSTFKAASRTLSIF